MDVRSIMAAPQLHPHPGRIRRLPDGSRRRGPRRRMASWRCYSRSFLLRLGQPTRSGFQLDDCLGHPTQSVAASCFSSSCSMTNIDTTARRPLSLVSRFARPPVTNRNSGASLRCARHSPDVKLLTSLFDWRERAIDMCLGSKAAWDTPARGGNPCKDWSLFGSRAGLKEPTAPVLVTWTLLIRRYRPPLVLQENVVFSFQSRSWLICWAWITKGSRLGWTRGGWDGQSPDKDAIRSLVVRVQPRTSQSNYWSPCSPPPSTLEVPQPLQSLLRAGLLCRIVNVSICLSTKSARGRTASLQRISYKTQHCAHEEPLRTELCAP